MLRVDSESAEKVVDEIIRNAYRMLMTRGQKFCYVYCKNPELEEYFRERF
ncbi:hypothetical protein KH172YL63_22160 [Bacillus sp. KH172YL63]|nr:DNA/RNA helicase domain-containing protein [Bacillus sp. KH172YL63]BCB04083.1 hypothetical protein KH172YL63_22160 [Bacillus sp. KH172YL63]